MSEAPTRTTRLEARIAPDALAAVKRAAELQGRSVSDFVVSAAQEAAHRTIRDMQMVQLSIEDQRRFAEALISPPPPGDLLHSASRLYAEYVDMR